MRLLEFAQTSNISMRELVAALEQKFDLERVGGNSRIYQVGDRYGVIYLLNNSLRGLGLIWPKASTHVQSVCVWNEIDFNASPDTIVDIPAEAQLADIIEPLVDFIKKPRIGMIESVGDNTDRFVPATEEEPEAQKIPSGQPLEPDTDIEKAQIVLMGRRADGTMFEIPGVEEMSRKLKQMVRAQAEKGETSGPSMEEQYEILDQKIELVAGGKSQFLKSLLITGMPSAGKTFRVMQKIKELGLTEGEDYIVKKGKITPRSLYRVLLEQINGLAIFDDCDSVVKYDDAVNMLKGALDTDPIREVSYDVKGLLNTAAMTKEKRDTFQYAMSKILRGKATLDDIRIFDVYRGVKTREAVAVSDDENDPNYHPAWYIEEMGLGETPNAQEQKDAEDWVMNNLPNKIDFQGRVIFISNMNEEEWTDIGDGAIMSRAFHQNMYFPDAEMLDYIDKIKQHIHAPALTERDKQEVLDYIRELWVAGRITKPVNFRLIQQAFDLFLMNDWRSLVANIG